MSNHDDSFTDPFNDPRFPDRPNHADFWSLSEIVLWLDGQAEARAGQDPFEYPITDVGIDRASLEYMAEQRAARFVTVLQTGNKPVLGSRIVTGFLVRFIAGLYQEAFIVGAKWERRKKA